MTLKEKFMRFMYGRYGVDTLGKYSLGAGLATMVLSIVFDSYTVTLIVVFYHFDIFSNVLSKPVQKIQREPDIPKQNLQTQNMVRQAKEYAHTKKNTSHLPLPGMQAENPRSPRKRTH